MRFLRNLWTDAKLWWRSMSKKEAAKSYETQRKKIDTMTITKPGVTLLVIVCMMLAGCGTVSEQYVKADRATYEAVAEDWVELQPEGMRKDMAKVTIKSWLARIEAAEEDNKK